MVELEEEKRKNKELEINFDNSLRVIELDRKDIKLLEEKIEKLNSQLFGAKGGYTKQINKLNAIILKNEKQAEIDLKIANNKILELNKQIEDLKSDRYLIKKLPTGRKPKAETMKVKSGALQSKIIEKVKRIEDE